MPAALVAPARFHSAPAGALEACALVSHASFPHHASNKSLLRSAVAEAENIVVEAAERIFADLADAQTINRDKTGAWKAPLWQALSEAGLPLSWVAEDHRSEEHTSELQSQ